MTKFLLHSSLIFTYVIYMLSQMELLKNYRDIVQYAIIFLMIISLFLIVKSYPTKIRQIFYQKRTIILLISIFLFNLVFSEPTSLLVVISKVLFLVFCLTDNYTFCEYFCSFTNQIHSLIVLVLFKFDIKHVYNSPRC